LRSDGVFIEAGSISKGDHYKLVVPNNSVPRIFMLCTVNSIPYSAVAGFMLFVTNLANNEVEGA
jgi:hypothetical protein